MGRRRTPSPASNSASRPPATRALYKSLLQDSA